MTPATTKTLTPGEGCIAAIAFVLASAMIRALFLLLGWNVGLVGADITQNGIGWWTALGLSLGLGAVGSAFRPNPTFGSGS